MSVDAFLPDVPRRIPAEGTSRSDECFRCRLIAARRPVEPFPRDLSEFAAVCGPVRTDCRHVFAPAVEHRHVIDPFERTLAVTECDVEWFRTGDDENRP